MKLPFLFHRLGIPVVRNPFPGFDPIYYLYWYRDVATFRAGPLVHYLEFGWKEGRDPSAGFSTDGYLSANSDVRAANINPLVHFLEHGLAAGALGWQKHPKAPAPPARAIKPPMKLLAAPVP